MRLYSKEEWPLIPWANTEEGRRMRAFFEPLLKEGVQPFISNVQSEIYILHIDALFIPITVNEKEYHNSFVCSMYSFLLYAEEEMRRHKRHLLRIFLSPCLMLLKLWFRWSKINQQVIVNNFLSSTNLYDHFSPQQASRVSKFLQARFPCHAIVFRSLNAYTEKNLIEALSERGGDLITSRSVYFFDPKYYPLLPSKKRWIIQKDIKLKEQDQIQILQHEDFQLSDATEMKRLYDLLYLEKYSYFNPAFTRRFFESALQDRTFNLCGVRYNGRLVGFIGLFNMKGILATPFAGYDTKLPANLGLYRLLIASALEESLSSNAIFHMSAGAGHFKRCRGAFQERESMAVFCDHLPIYRRFIWKILRTLFNEIGARMLKKYKL